MPKLYVIESRTPDGKLDLTGRQPEDVFGREAITGIDDWRMSQIVYRHVPDAVMRGEEIARWPALIDARWVAREKYWTGERAPLKRIS